MEARSRAFAPFGFSRKRPSLKRNLEKARERA
jgi:hypothetical protein